MKTLVIGRESRVLDKNYDFISSSKVLNLTSDDLLKFEQIIFASYTRCLQSKHTKLLKIAVWLASTWKRRLIFLSSDHVFSGNKGFYSTTDFPDPKSAYGMAKVELENILIKFCILRFTTYGPSQSQRPLLLEMIERQNSLTLNPNQYFSPVSTAEINYFCNQKGSLPKLVHLSGPRISKASFILSKINNIKDYELKYNFTRSDHSLVNGINK